MAVLQQGIYLGVLLGILVGPLLVALVQTSLEQGTVAGVAVGFGIWVSDFLYILTVYFGFRYVNQMTQWPSFEITLGLLGALVLLVSGISTLLTPPPDLENPNTILKGTKGYLALWSKGFIINTLNPFTIFFWISVMTGVVLKNEYNEHQSRLFFAGLLGTVIFTDTLKILLAKLIRHRLTTHHLWWIRRVAGISLIVFAIVLAIRVIL